MKLLLDTHVLLWSLLTPEKLSSQVADELENAQNELWFSPITVWEILVLIEKGRVALDAGEPEAWIREALKEAPLKEAPLNTEVAIQSRLLGLLHNDPADRFIAASAKVYDLILVTADSRLLALKGLQTLKAA